MKRITLILTFGFFLTFCKGQEPLTYSGVVFVDSVSSKEELFERGRIWFANTFKDSKEVLQVNDKENGELIGRGAMKFESETFSGSSATRGYIYFDIKVYTKQGRYRYEVTNFTHEGTGGSSYGAIYPPLSFGLITHDSLCPTNKLGEEYNTKTGDKWRNKLWKEFREKIGANTFSLVESLKTAMKTVSPAKRDDW